MARFATGSFRAVLLQEGTVRLVPRPLVEGRIGIAASGSTVGPCLDSGT